MNFYGFKIGHPFEGDADEKHTKCYTVFCIMNLTKALFFKARCCIMKWISTIA